MKKEILIAAHRGTSGGNLIQNTIEAYENALLQGADIIEADVVMTVDGVFYMLHNGQEKNLFGIDTKLTEMTSAEVEKLRFRNVWNASTDKKPDRLDDVLEHFKGRCLINIDRSWFYGKALFDLLDRHRMNEQIILKNHGMQEDLELVEAYGKGLLYMPILKDTTALTRMEQRKISYYGVEVVFTSPDSEFASEEFIEQLHKKKKKIWVNTLTLDDKTVLSGGHDDNTAVLRSMDEGWGWHVDRGYDIIQTDWPLLLRSYLDRRQTMEL